MKKIWGSIQDQALKNRKNRIWWLMAAILMLMVVVWLIVSVVAGIFNITSSEKFSLDQPLASKQGPKLSQFTPLRQFNLDPEDRILVQSLKDSDLNVGVSHRTDEPLLAEVVNQEATSELVEEPEVVPWFYYSPNVAKLSLKSRANRYQLIKEESINQFAWYQAAGKVYLFQFGQPYTGWHDLPFEGWRYYQQGLATDQVIDIPQAKQMNSQRERLAKLMPRPQWRTIYLTPKGQYSANAAIKPVQYSILYKNTDALIMTAPPGSKGSGLLTTTENFFEMPMEVVEEAQTLNGEWLHVNIGYEDLGWIKKDTTYQDYVLTYYSERELLDTIDQILQEEVDGINARVGASFINNETMAQTSYNNQIFFPASTQKIYVLGELYHQYKTGQLSPETVVTLYDEDKVPGAGIIQGYANGSQFTIDELVDLVSIYSDNTAANLIIDTVGGGPVINPHIHQMGLYDTYIQGKYYGGDSTWFTTSPADAARFFAYLANNQVNGEPWDEMLINKFTMNTHTFLRTYIWGDTRSWNKSGLGGTEQNDVAAFVTPYGEYSLAVYTAEPGNYDIIGEQVAQLSVRVHEAFNDIRSKLWISVDETTRADQ
ncbi:serine hydrolase [Ignavigranum ruoffiae]